MRLKALVLSVVTSPVCLCDVIIKQKAEEETKGKGQKQKRQGDEATRLQDFEKKKKKKKKKKNQTMSSLLVSVREYECVREWEHVCVCERA